MTACKRRYTPTHTHTQHGIAVERIEGNEMCHSPLNYDLMSRFKSFGCVVASHVVSLFSTSSLRVRFLTHRLCSKRVGDEEDSKKMKRRTPLAHTLFFFFFKLSSHTLLMQQVYKKREGRDGRRVVLLQHTHTHTHTPLPSSSTLPSSHTHTHTSS